MLFLIFHSLNVSLHAYNGAFCLLDVEVASHAREKAGIQDTCKQSRIAVITAVLRRAPCLVSRDSCKGQGKTQIGCKESCEELQPVQACDRAEVLRLDCPGIARHSKHTALTKYLLCKCVAANCL